MIWATLMLLQAAAAPSPEAVVLGRRLAETGPLASLLPLIAAKETDEMVASNPKLTAAEQAELRRIAAETLAAGSAKVHTAQGEAYARALSIEDLRALVAFNTSAVAVRYRTAQPAAIMAVVSMPGGLDFKRDTMAAFCTRTGKGCAK